MAAEKNLFLFTTGYPFGIIEDFLHQEVLFHSNYFNTIYIFVPKTVAHLEKRILPDNVHVILVKKGVRFKALFHLRFWRALIMDLNGLQFYTFSTRQFKEALVFFSAGLDSLKAAKRIQRKINHQPLSLYSYWFNEGALAISLLKGGTIVGRTCRAHGWDIYKERHLSSYLPFRKWLGLHLTLVSAVSNAGKKYLQQTFGLPADKVETNYLGTPELIKKESLKQEIQKFQLLSCSNVIPLKRVELIIEVLCRLDFEIHWTHIGDGGCFDDIKKKSQKELPKNITYSLIGEISNTEVRSLYSQTDFDLFINLSETEGLPVSMMEALSMGVPIVATNVGGVNEIVIEDETGWLVNDVEIVKHATNRIKDYSRLPVEKKNMIKEKCLNHWATHFNADKNYKAFQAKL